MLLQPIKLPPRLVSVALGPETLPPPRAPYFTRNCPGRRAGGIPISNPPGVGEEASLQVRRQQDQISTLGSPRAPRSLLPPTAPCMTPRLSHPRLCRCWAWRCWAWRRWTRCWWLGSVYRYGGWPRVAQVKAEGLGTPSLTQSLPCQVQWCLSLEQESESELEPSLGKCRVSAESLGLDNRVRRV